jgi:hypothetical protein
MNILQRLSQTLDLLVFDEHPEPPTLPEMGIPTGMDLPAPADLHIVVDPDLDPASEMPFASILDPNLAAAPALPFEPAPSGFWNTLSSMVQNLFSFDGAGVAGGDAMPGQPSLDQLQDVSQMSQMGMPDPLQGLTNMHSGLGMDSGIIHNVTHDLPSNTHFGGGGGGGTGFPGM